MYVQQHYILPIKEEILLLKVHLLSFFYFYFFIAVHGKMLLNKMYDTLWDELMCQSNQLWCVWTASHHRVITVLLLFPSY